MGPDHDALQRQGQLRTSPYLRCVNYRICGVCRERTEGREGIIRAKLVTEDGDDSAVGTLQQIIALCETKGYNVLNMEVAKQALIKMTS